MRSCDAGPLGTEGEDGSPGHHGSRPRALSPAARGPGDHGVNAGPRGLELAALLCLPCQPGSRGVQSCHRCSCSPRAMACGAAGAGGASAQVAGAGVCPGSQSLHVDYRVRRDQAIVWTLYATGLGVSDVRLLRWAQIDDKLLVISVPVRNRPVRTVRLDAPERGGIQGIAQQRCHCRARAGA